MTTLEFAKKCLTKAQMNLERIKRRPVARKDELDVLNDKVKHYEAIVRSLEEKAQKKKKFEEKMERKKGELLMKKCETCEIYKNMPEKGCVCSWYMDNVVLDNKTVSDCTAYQPIKEEIDE